ncbi:MAG: hypothetical protein F9K32_00570 [Desulfobulbaceae bacterium]|nr:MAG: hypothetical protein F9K32_00570 [Desulfobulbaceae bacterium]
MKKPKIQVIDAVMGTGKSTWIIKNMIKNHSEKYVVVLPLLSEVERYRIALKDHRAVYAPDPEEIDSPTIQTKLDAFKERLKNGAEVIVTTHALFSLWDQECFDHIKDHGYICILDETVDLVQETHIKNDDYQMLLNSGYIEEESYQGNENLKSIHSTPKTSMYDGEFSGFIKHALLNNLIRMDGNICIRTIKPENIIAFRHCYVLTYMYPGSQMDCWFKLYGVEVNHKTLVRDALMGDLHLADHPGFYSGAQFADLITLERSQKMLEVGARTRKKTIPLSNNDFGSMDHRRWEQLANNLVNFARHKTLKFINDAIGDDVSHPGYYLLWTVKNQFRSKFEEKLRYRQVPGFDGPEREIFLPHNSRATNDYAHKACLAYMTTPMLRVPIAKFFKSCGLDFNDELFMLSTLLQWVWRSRIRNLQEILLYIPSEPLRCLFSQWMKGEVVVRV